MKHILLVEITVQCPFFDFETFPLDHQICHLILYSPPVDDFKIIGHVEFRGHTLEKQHPTIPFVISNQTIANDSSVLQWVKNNNLSYIGTEINFKRWIWPYLR